MPDDVCWPLVAAVFGTGGRHAAESARLAALSFATEAGHAEVTGWAHEMRAWFALTAGDCRGALAAARAGVDVAPHHGVTVQLAAQEAKAWARLGVRREAEAALDKGRRLLERMPYPENPEDHFVVDPAKFDSYAMDCHRVTGADKLARTLAEEVLRAGTAVDGTERSPMRNAEARITLGVTAARAGGPGAGPPRGRAGPGSGAVVRPVPAHARPGTRRRAAATVRRRAGGTGAPRAAARPGRHGRARTSADARLHAPVSAGLTPEGRARIAAGRASRAHTAGTRRSSHRKLPLPFAQRSPWIPTGASSAGAPAASCRGRW